MLCHHCAQSNVNRPRGLCVGCYRDPEIRERYAVTPAGRKEGCWRTGESVSATMTLTQLDALIAEQQQHLPEWWEEDSRRMGNPERVLR